MKRIGLFLCTIFICVICHADTINLHWLNEDGSSYQNSTCTVNGDLNVPSTQPTKRGYDFVGWNVRAAKELEYIFFQGNGFSYIDTGIKFDSDEIEYNIKIRFNSNYTAAFGAAESCTDTYNTTNSSGILGITASNSISVFTVGGWKKETQTQSGAINTYNLYIKKSDNIIRLTINNNMQNGVVSGPITSNKNIYLGKVNIGNDNNVTACALKNAYVYYFKIKKDGVLVLDLVPAKDPDGVVCFWDNVSKTFFYKVAGADLVAGPVVGE